MYSKKVMEHFLRPHNLGEIKNPDAIGKAGNIVCGDVMYIYLRVRNKTIKDIKFKTLGCAAAISTSSIVTDLAKGKTLDEALKIIDKDVVKSLDGLPLVKVHCSLLAVKALREAIYDYLSKNQLPIPEGLKKIHQTVEKEVELAEKRYQKMVKGGMEYENHQE